MPRLLPDILRNAARKSGQGGFVCGGVQTTYADIDLFSDRLANALIERGVKPGDRVVTVLSDSVEFICACFGIWKSGAIIVPEHTFIPPTNLRRILVDVRATALIIDGIGFERLEQMVDPALGVKAVFIKDYTSTLAGRSDIHVGSLEAILRSEVDLYGMLPTRGSPADVASITYTSGSTGNSKGVMHTHDSWLAGIEFTHDYLGLSENDKIVVSLPLHHGLAFRHILAYVLAGGTVLITRDIYQALRLLRKEHPTALLLVPAAANIAIEHFATVLREAGSYLRYVEIGSAAMAPEQLERLRNLLPNTRVHLPYGLTEARVGYLDRGAHGLLNRVVALSPGLKLRVVDDEGRSVAPGETGEILLQGRGLMKGYWGGAETEWKAVQGQGFRTRDMGRVDINGEVELLGRLDDVLKIGGRKVNPMEVEMVLNGHPNLVESAVIGLPDATGILEYTLHAFVVLKKDTSLKQSDIVTHCRQYLEPYKIPTQIHFRSSLPRSPVGKIIRQALALQIA